MLSFGPLPSESSLRLILLRHGEPEAQVHGRCYGNLDVGLSDNGRDAVRAKLSSLGGLRVSALYTSPLKRAVETAAIAEASLGMKAIAAPELREINFGAFEGLTYPEIEQRYPKEYRLWMECPTEVTFPSGECFMDMKVRVLKFMESLFALHEQGTVTIVAHGGPNRVILADALGIPAAMVFRIDQSYAAVNVIDYIERCPIVRLVNA